VRVQLSIALPDDGLLDVAIDVDDDLPVATVAAALARTAGVPVEGLFLGGERLPDDLPVGESALVDGSVVRLSEAATAGECPLPSGRGWQLHVVSGPGSGLVAELPVGTIELGRSSSVGFPDRSMSRRHAVLRITADDPL
jgi:S-DNA-T family DNA segregation ATPase FtsK/SpoIIIE